MATYTLVKATEETLDYLYSESALTFEGTSTDDDNMKWLCNWLVENKFLDEKAHLTIYDVTGKLMNSYYGLTGRNRYKARLNIVCVPLSQLGNIGSLALARFQLGGRWFDDVVSNNARREGYDA